MSGDGFENLAVIGRGNSILYSFLVNTRILQFHTLLVPRKYVNTTIQLLYSFLVNT